MLLSGANRLKPHWLWLCFPSLYRQYPLLPSLLFSPIFPTFQLGKTVHILYMLTSRQVWISFMSMKQDTFEGRALVWIQYLIIWNFLIHLPSFYKFEGIQNLLRSAFLQQMCPKLARKFRKYWRRGLRINRNQAKPQCGVPRAGWQSILESSLMTNRFSRVWHHATSSIKQETNLKTEIKVGGPRERGSLFT